MKKPRAIERPQAAQIDAVERSLQSGDVAAAAQKLKRLETLFPGYKPLKRLAYHVAWAGRRDVEAVFLAWEWCEASPNSAPAFAALAESAERNFPFLHFHALQKMAALEEKSAAEIEASLAAHKQALLASLQEDTVLEEAFQLDLARVLMGNRQMAQAQALLVGMRCAAAQNNLGQCLFSQGKIEEAEAIWRQALADRPENCFALCRLIVVRLWLGGRAALGELEETLLAFSAKNIDDALNQIEALVLLGHLDEAETRFQTARERFIDDEVNCASMLTQVVREKIILAGVFIAWRQGNADEAMRRLDQKDNGSEMLHGLYMQCMLARMKADVPDFAFGESGQWWPVEALRPLLAKNPDTDEALCRHWPVSLPHVDYLLALAACAEKKNNTLTYPLLRHLALGDGAQREAARAGLIGLLRQPCGPDAGRNELHLWLCQQGVVDSEVPQTVWISGKLSEIRQLDITIRSDAMEEDTVLSPKHQKIYERIVGLVGEGHNAKALQLAEALYQDYPDHPRAQILLATLREAEKQPLAAWVPLVRRAFDLDPDYFFARTAMSKLLVAEGRLDAAREMLRPLSDIREMHVTEWRALLVAQLAIARAEDDMPTIIRLNGMLRDCAENMG